MSTLNVRILFSRPSTCVSVKPGHAFLHDSIKLRPQLTDRLDQLSALDGQFGLALLQPIKLLFQLAKIQAGLFGLVHFLPAVSRLTGRAFSFSISWLSESLVPCEEATSTW